MIVHRDLISTIADEWSASAGDAFDAVTGGVMCSGCATSDLVSELGAAVWPHGALHRLLAPIEEVLDSAVETYIATSPDREATLHLVEAYRTELRSTARSVVDQALLRGNFLGAVPV